MIKKRLKHAFTSGEISPLMFDRYDFDRYKNGAKKLYNALCVSQGPVTGRTGLEFLFNLNDLGIDVSDPQIRMEPFIFSKEQAYNMIFFKDNSGTQRCVFGTDTGLVVFPDPPPTECPPKTIYSLNSVVSIGGELFVAGDTGVIYKYDGSWSRLDSTTKNNLKGSWALDSKKVYFVGAFNTIIYYNGSLCDKQDTSVSDSLNAIYGFAEDDIYVVGNNGIVLHNDGSGWDSLDSGTDKNLNAVWGNATTNVYAVGDEGKVIKYNGTSWSSIAVPGSSALGLQDDVNGVWGTAANNVYIVGDNGALVKWNGSTWSYISLSTTEDLLAIHGDSASSIYVVGSAGSIWYYDGSTWTAQSSGTPEDIVSIFSLGASEAYMACSGGLIQEWDGSTWEEVEYGSLISVSAGDVVSIDFPAEWDNLSFDFAQVNDEVYFAQTNLNPHILKRYSHYCWELVSKTFTDQPEEWSASYGWPETITFYNQRLYFGGNTLKPQSVWASKAGDLDDFGKSSPGVDSDGFTFTLSSGNQNKIVWLSSGSELYIGTLADEWAVKGSDNIAITASNPWARTYTNNGSESFKPVKINNVQMFLGRHGRNIFEYSWSYEDDGYITSDMSILAPHLTENESIIDWAYQQVPDSILWSIREDGELLGFTYQRQHKVTGWHQHHTNGQFKAICCIPDSSREDGLYAIVQREVNGQTVFYYERFASRFSADTAEWGRFLDSHIVFNSGAVSSVSVPHLKNEEVSILADGCVLPSATVASDGTLVLSRESTHIVVGLPYEVEIQPTLPVFDTEEGVSKGGIESIIEIYLSFYKSLGCKIGYYKNSGERHIEEVLFRDPGDLTNTQLPLFSGYKRVPFPEGYDIDLTYFIIQDYPLPITVRSVIDLYEVNF